MYQCTTLTVVQIIIQFPAMEGVRTFLESSTIHGLTYISTTRKCVRIFWIGIVIAGFSGAAYMINESFQNWAENPAITNIELLPL